MASSNNSYSVLGGSGISGMLKCGVVGGRNSMLSVKRMVDIFDGVGLCRLSLFR